MSGYDIAVVDQLFRGCLRRGRRLPPIEMLGVWLRLRDHHENLRLVASDVFRAVRHLGVGKNSLSGSELERFRSYDEAYLAAEYVAVLLTLMGNQHSHAVLAGKHQVEDLEVVFGHAAGKKTPFIASAADALVGKRSFHRVRGSFASRHARGAIKQFTDRDLEHLRDANEVRDRGGDAAALQSR